MNLINRTKAKQYILNKAHKMGRTKFSQVSMKEMEPKMQAALDRWLNDYLHRLPSIGKTIK
jgi:hypothetical protein